MARPRKGNVLKYGLVWSVGLIGFFALMAIVDNRIFTVFLMVVWTVFWYVLYYRDGQRKKPSPRSRF